MGRKEINATYYEKHKATLSWSRKKKYKEDSEYREKVKEQAKSRYLEEKSKRELQERVVVIDGKPVLVRSVSVLKEITGVDSNTIRNWILEGVLPPPTMIDDFGRRWFSQDYINKVSTAVMLYKETPNCGLGRLRELLKGL